MQVVESEQLISDKARRQWAGWTQQLETVQSKQGSAPNVPADLQMGTPTGDGSSEMYSACEVIGVNDIQDTVGAVAWSSEGGLSAGVSR